MPTQWTSYSTLVSLYYIKIDDLTVFLFRVHNIFNLLMILINCSRKVTNIANLFSCIIAMPLFINHHDLHIKYIDKKNILYGFLYPLVVDIKITIFYNWFYFIII
jgi:hypothetical protein